MKLNLYFNMIYFMHIHFKESFLWVILLTKWEVLENNNKLSIPFSDQVGIKALGCLIDRVIACLFDLKGV